MEYKGHGTYFVLIFYFNLYECLFNKKGIKYLLYSYLPQICYVAFAVDTLGLVA